MVGSCEAALQKYLKQETQTVYLHILADTGYFADLLCVPIDLFSLSFTDRFDGFSADYHFIELLRTIFPCSTIRPLAGLTEQYRIVIPFIYDPG